jgi:hypothetical protein
VGDVLVRAFNQTVLKAGYHLDETLKHLMLLSLPDKAY